MHLKLFVGSLRQFYATVARRVSTKMPDPYRESYSPLKDPVPISGFLLVVTPLAWMFYDIGFQTDKAIEPK